MYGAARPSRQQPLQPPLSSPAGTAVSPPPNSHQPLTAPLHTVPTVVPQGRIIILQDRNVSVVQPPEKKKKKGAAAQEKQQNTPGVPLLGFFAATLLGKALPAPAPYPGTPASFSSVPSNRYIISFASRVQTEKKDCHTCFLHHPPTGPMSIIISTGYILSRIKCFR